MTWHSRLKKISEHTKPEATKPTKPGFVGFVAPILVNVEKNEDIPRVGNPTAKHPDWIGDWTKFGDTLKREEATRLDTPPANDTAPTTKVQPDLPTPDVKGLPTSPADNASGWRVTVPIGTTPATLAKFRTASLALDAAVLTESGNNPDRWCYPNSTAMNTREIDLFAARLARLTDKGVPAADAEPLADKLVTRDREQDDRRLCLECTHLLGYGRTSWRCSNWQQAGISVSARDNQLAPDLAMQLQRCDGFTNATKATLKAPQ